MAHAAWPLGRHPPNPILANSRPASPPPARRPDAPPRAAQGTACGERSDSGKMTRCQYKQAPEHAQNKVHHANDAVLKTEGISRLDSSHKYRMHRSSGGGDTYSKPDARVKLIPAEGITYVRHGKPFGRTVGLAGSQKRHCGRSATPPSSCKVSLVGSTSLNQKPTPPASPIASCLSPKKLETAENGYSFVGDYITSSLTTQIASLKNRPSPSCKAVLSQPSVTSMVNDATVSKNLSRTDSSEAFVRSCSSSVLHCQVQSSAIPPVGLLKEAVINPISPSSVHVLAAHSSESPLGSKAEPSSKRVCTPDNGKLCSTAPFVQKEPTVKPTMLSPTSVLSERSTEVHQGTRSRPSSRLNLFDGQCNLASLQCKTTIPPTQSHSEDPESAPVILHTKLHKKNYQTEACWKGKFEVIGKLTHTCDGLEAHFPFEIFIKVYEASKQMPEILKLEALPLSRLWPKMFKMKPPDGQDIGLCFISSLQRSNRNFDHLLENTSSHIGLRAYVGTMELLIFSSKLLTQDYQKKSGKFYFWGVFRKHLRKKQHRPNNQTNNVISDASLSNGDSCGRSEEIGMNLDLIEGKEAKSDKCEIGTELDTTGGEGMARDKSKEIGKILDVTGDKEAERDNRGEIGIRLDVTRDKETEKVNKCLAMLETTDSNAAASCAAPAASSVSGCCSPDSADSPCQSATRTPAGSDLVLDTPPGFPLDVPPGFTKAHCLLRTGETAESFVDSSPSPVSDTPPGFPLDVPPGFTKAYCQLHAGETAESYIASFPSLGLGTPGFPLDIPPGFTEAHCRLPTITSTGAEAGVSTPGSEKKPLIKFSLNVRSPVQTAVPPGFTRLLALKKEPGFRSVYKATERITPIGKADEIKIKQEDTTCKKTCGDTRIAGNLSPYECKQTPKSHECFTESLTHLWVDFFGVRIPTQVNVKTSTVGDLIEVALEKKGLGKSLKSYDAYVTYCGYIVTEDQLLSSLLIYRDSTFLVHHRVRGGMVLELIDCQSFVDHVNLADRFHSVFLPKRLRPPGTGVIEVVSLSQHGRCSLHAMLVCLSAIHFHGQSLDGNFDIQDIIFSGTIAVIRSNVIRVTLDEEKFKKDYAKLADIIETWFAMNGQHPVLYVNHLLGLLRGFPSDKIYSECFRCYINNHCCVMSFLERLNLYQALDRYYHFRSRITRKLLQTLWVCLMGGHLSFSL